ncbi:hypothetical protein L914_17786, partial [Phytophthora nicotianae]
TRPQTPEAAAASGGRCVVTDTAGFKTERNSEVAKPTTRAENKCGMCVPKDTAGAENELDADATTDTRSVGSTEGSACAIRDFESYCSGCMAKDTVVAADNQGSVCVAKYTRSVENKFIACVTREAASLNTKCSLFVVKSTKGLEKKLNVFLKFAAFSQLSS